MAVFVGSSLACGLAPSIAVLVAARCAQGLGAALAVPSSLALLQAVYPERSARARAVGIWGGVAGIAAGTGPVLGGVLVSALGWRSVFFVNVPVGAAGLLLAHRVLPPAPRRAHGADVPGQVTAAAGLGAATAALVEAGRLGWTSPVVLACAGAAIACAVAFVAVEHRAPAPMLPLGLFSSPTFRGATIVGFLINFGFYGQLFVTSLYLQQVRGLSPLLAGVALFPEAAMPVVGSTVSGRVTARTGPRRPMLVGLALGAAGFGGLVVIGAHTPYAALVGPLMAVGLGMSLTMPAATVAVLEASPGSRAGLASGVLNAARQVGGVVGVALLGTLAAGHPLPVAGLRVGMVAAAAAFLGGTVLTATSVEAHQAGG